MKSTFIILSCSSGGQLRISYTRAPVQLLPWNGWTPEGENQSQLYIYAILMKFPSASLLGVPQAVSRGVHQASSWKSKRKVPPNVKVRVCRSDYTATELHQMGRSQTRKRWRFEAVSAQEENPGSSPKVSNLLKSVSHLKGSSPAPEDLSQLPLQ